MSDLDNMKMKAEAKQEKAVAEGDRAHGPNEARVEATKFGPDGEDRIVVETPEEVELKEKSANAANEGRIEAHEKFTEGKAKK